MTLSDVTDREAVLSAITEYDRLGKDEFLRLHGFGPAQRYSVLYEGRTYDSKAIIGVAHGYQYPDLGPLRSADFSGGIGTAVSRLEALGFEVVDEGRSGSSPSWDLRIGDTITRVELHDRFGGSRQDGVSPSAQTPNVFLFTDPASGEQHGYFDSWGEDGIFYYTGRGQRGNQTFTSGNRRILEHRQDATALRVFRGTGGVITYAGRFTLDEADPFTYREAPETGGGPLRQVIVFKLIPLPEPGEHQKPSTPAKTSTDSVGVDHHPLDSNVEVALAQSAIAPNPDLYGRGLRAHRKLENELAVAVAAAGWIPKSPAVTDVDFDLAWWIEDELVVVEVKSITDANEVRQLRTGVGQLIDYDDSLRSKHPVHPILYIERRPSDPRWIELCLRHGVQLLWPEVVLDAFHAMLGHDEQKSTRPA